MPLQQNLLAMTPRGSSIYKLDRGGYQVCDPDRRCHFVDDLHKAEEDVREMEQAYGYPYTSGFHEIVH